MSSPVLGGASNAGLSLRYLVPQWLHDNRGFFNIWGCDFSHIVS
jgi:hypothetical protein